MADKASTAQGGDAMVDLYKFMYFIAIGLGLIVYLQVLRNRRYWVIMETALGVMSLIMILFANTVMAQYQSTGSDSLAIYLFRIMALARTSRSAVVFLTRNSRDPTVAISVSLTNILSRAAVTICALHGIFYTTTISQSALKSDLVSKLLLIIGDIFQLSKLTTKEGTQAIGGPISFHLSIDGVLKLMLGSWVFGFPDTFLAIVNPTVTPTEGHLALAQVFGCFVFGQAVISFAALRFKNHEDAINVLKSKLTLYVPAILLAVVNFLVDPNYRNSGHAITVIGGMIVLAFNAGYAVLQYDKEKMY